MVMPYNRNLASASDPLALNNRDPWARQPFQSRITSGFYNSNGTYNPNVGGPTYVPNFMTTSVFGGLGGGFGNAPAGDVNSLYGVQTNLMSPSQLYGPPAPAASSPGQFPAKTNFYPSQTGFIGPIQPLNNNLVDPSFTPLPLPNGPVGYTSRSPYSGGPLEAQRYQNLLGTGPSIGSPYQTGGYTGPFGVTAGLPAIGGRILGPPETNQSQSQSLLPPPSSNNPPPQKETGWHQVLKNGKLKWVLIRNRQHQQRAWDQEKARKQAAAMDQGRTVEQSLNWRVATG